MQMKYYNVPVYKATICNTKPFVNIEKLGFSVVGKARNSSVVVDPTTEVEILIQKSRYAARGLIKMNQEQVTQNGFQLFVYGNQLTEENQVTEEYYNRWLASSTYSNLYHCCQEIMEEDRKNAYAKTRGKRR